MRLVLHMSFAFSPEVVGIMTMVGQWINCDQSEFVREVDYFDQSEENVKDTSNRFGDWCSGTRSCRKEG